LRVRKPTPRNEGVINTGQIKQPINESMGPRGNVGAYRRIKQ